MPTWGEETANGVHGGSAFGISAESKAPGAALTFLRWLSTAPAVPRIGAKVTFPSPAYRSARRVAREAYDDTYFTGDPVHDVLDEAATRVPAWTWGPNALSVFSAAADALGPVPTGATTMTKAMHRLQSSAVTTMRERGLAVTNGART